MSGTRDHPERGERIAAGSRRHPAPAAALIASLVCAGTALPARAAPGAVVAAGGALDPDQAAVYEIVLAGRLDGLPVCVSPTASTEPERSAQAAVGAFVRHGGADAAVAIELTAERAVDAELVARIAERCGGFFFTGGDASRIVDALRPAGVDTPALGAIRAVHERGGVVAGASAGAAALSDPTIAGGTSADALRHGVHDEEGEDGVWLRQGLGIVADMLLDQHFLSRGRFARLVVAVLDCGCTRRGFGIDEDTALIVRGRRAEVVGRSGVVAFELPIGIPADVRAPFEGARLWLLGDGDRLDLDAFTAEPGPGKEPLELRRTLSNDPRDPWSGDRFHRLLAQFARSVASSATIHSAGHDLRFRKGEGFRSLARAGKTPRGLPDALFAGPFEVDLSTPIDYHEGGR